MFALLHTTGPTTTTTIINTDDETNGITIAKTGFTSGDDFLTTEAGSITTFTIILEAQPTTDVTISIAGLRTTEISLITDTLTFTTANWDTPQTVTVAASNTGGDAGTETGTTTSEQTFHRRQHPTRRNLCRMGHQRPERSSLHLHLHPKGMQYTT